MAESLLLGIAQGLLGKIASPAFQKAIEIYCVEDQIHELENTVTAITAVLLDAEEQREKKQGLQLWLRRLQDVLYDAEDVLDDVECEDLRKKVTCQYGGVKEKVLGFFSLSNPLILRTKIIHKIKEFRKTLSEISTEKNRFDLNARSFDDGVVHMQSRKMTYSFINKPDIVGRDDDKKKIIKILMQSDDEDLSVIPIVGLGGMGKTALAKLVYNDDHVKEQFEQRLWVCVPEDFDLKKTIEAIIKDAKAQRLSNLDIPQLGNLDIQQLQTYLRDIIKDKKFLLVLDDVWSDDRSRWKELRDLLSGGVSGSKIIVTTRYSKVASMMGTHEAHNLKGLSHQDSMTLFLKWAFDEKEKQLRTELLDIGKHIVEKCQGVPLLIKSLGSLLYTKDDVWYWAKVRDSEIWEVVKEKKDILLVLKLSYDHLPSNLKRCFATFSLFPRGHEFQHGELVCLWMALGLISSPIEKPALEDVGVEYVNEFWKRSLIQEVEDLGFLLTFKVHDLVHSLATIVAKNDCSIVGFDTTEILEGTRYISFSSDSLEGISNFDGVPPFMRKPTSKRFRVIKFQFEVDDGVTIREFIRTCISNCKHLRYLDLRWGSFEKLPSSLCSLKQLRSLSLAHNKRLKKLPDTICELQSLLHLFLHGCSELGDLPKNMNRLVSLRYLTITTKKKSLQESGIQYLENLYYLGLYGCQNLQVLFEGTCQLTCLRWLDIEACEGPISLPLMELVALERLAIGNSKLTLTQENKSIFPPNLCVLAMEESEQVMELLQCLEESACNLECLLIYNCPRFTAIPEWLPNHTRLRLIELNDCPNLSSMPQGIHSLPALKELRINDCGELSKIYQPTCGKDWPKIAHIPQIAIDDIRVQGAET